MARTTKQSGEVLVAIESWTCNDDAGNAVVVHRGSRWRSDDPIVNRRPDLFIRDGATEGEVISARESAGIAGY
jgi:hypothetical protein